MAKRRRSKGKEFKRKARDVREWYRHNRANYTREDLEYGLGLTRAEANAAYTFLRHAERTAKEQRFDAEGDEYGMHHWVITEPTPDLSGLEAALRGPKPKKSNPVKRITNPKSSSRLSAMLRKATK
jgi:hypothetical protein